MWKDETNTYLSVKRKGQQETRTQQFIKRWKAFATLGVTVPLSLTLLCHVTRDMQKAMWHMSRAWQCDSKHKDSAPYVIDLWGIPWPNLILYNIYYSFDAGFKGYG